MATVTEVGPRLGIAPTCAALALPRATYYRCRRPQRAALARPPSPRALSDAERTAVLTVLHEPRFVDLAPAEVYATLLDEGQYHCSERTMYRLLAAHQEVRERRNQLRHPRYAAPELLARRPNELWSWDITKLLGPAKWTYFYLYVMLDSCGAPGYVESRPEAQASVGFWGLRLHITGVASQRLKPRED
jgi:putative transposase